MAIDEILINAQPGQTRVALLEDGRLVELLLARGDLAGVAGNVYLGRVEKVVPGIEAAFVDIGLERVGFLALPEVRPFGVDGGGDRIGDYLSEGDAVLVQAVRDPEPGKGAKLTTRVTLPGRYSVFLPMEPAVYVSKRIEDRETRHRLKVWAEKLLEDDEGLLLRTAALDAEREDLAREAGSLRQVWTAICGARDTKRPPQCLYAEPGPAQRAVRDFAGPEIRRIRVDDPQTLKQIETFCQEHAPAPGGCLEGHVGPEPLFAAAGIEGQIDAAREALVTLPSGGSLIIEGTSTLTAIDVNSGGGGSGGKEATALSTNLEAVEELARQVRLRDLSGLLVVDFLRMRASRNRQRVIEALRHAAAPDPRTPHVIGFTTSGLVEMTRRKQGEPLDRQLGTPCACCNGSGRTLAPETLAFEILRAIPPEARANPGKALRVKAAPGVIEALDGAAREARTEVERRLARPLGLVPDETVGPDTYEILTEN